MNRLLVTGWTFIVWFIAMPLLAAEDAIHIALIHSDEKQTEISSGANVNGIMLFLEQINLRGGVAGRKIVIDHYNDMEDRNTAIAVAEQIVSDNRAVAVIGHEYSSNTLATRDIYANAAIPVVSFSATNNRVTLDNPWIFRTIFNDSAQGSFLANYAVTVLEQKRVTIVKETLPYGDYLGDVFAQTVRGLGAEVDTVHIINPESDDLDAKVTAITTAIVSRGAEAGLIFLSVHGSEAIKLVQQLRDAAVTNELMGPDTVASTTFVTGFSNLTQEKRQPGFYTNGIHVTAPINFDAANEEAQQFMQRYRQLYGIKPDWNAAYAYDTIKVLVTVLESVVSQGAMTDLATTRQLVRDQLAAMVTPDMAVSGVTGLNYFDDNGDSNKPVSVGQYFNNSVVSGMVHFEAVPDIDQVSHLQQEMEAGRIVLLNGNYMFRKSMVYTGVKLHKIGPYDLEEEKVTLDFTLWFRYRGDIQPQQITFRNAVEPIKLDEPIRSESNGDEHYLSYRIKSEFRPNFILSRILLGEHVAGISFRHNSLSRDSLLYINDVIGMGLTGEVTLSDKVQRGLITEKLDNWHIEGANAFEQVIPVDSLGMPEYLHRSSADIPFSNFSYVVQLKSSNLTLRGLLPSDMVENVLLISGVILLLLLGWRKLRKQPCVSAALWLIEVLALLLVLISAEMWVIDRYLISQELYIQEMIMKGIDTLWWLIPAMVINDAIEIFFWQVIERTSGRQIPGVVRLIVAIIIYTLALFGVVAFVFDQKLTGLMATSGLIAMILGLALQMNLSNIFSGIALNIEHPFRVGDWVRIGEHEGKVLDVTWRSTRIETRIKHLISIPNTPVADSPIINYSAYGYARMQFEIGIHTVHPPELVKQTILNALYSLPIILREPCPKTYFHGIEEGTGNYTVIFSFDDYANRNSVTEAVWMQITNYLNRSGITIVPRMNRIAMNRPEPEPMFEIELIELLQQIPIFRNFPSEYLPQLAAIAIRKELRQGERFIQQGDMSNSMYLVADGVLSVCWRDPDSGEELEVGRLAVNDSLGGHGLLYGEPRTASVEAITDAVVYELNRKDIAPLLKKNPIVLRAFRDATRQQISQTTEEVTKHQEVKHARKKGVFSRFMRGVAGMKA